MNIAIDTGGTFTDIILYDMKKSIFWTDKIPSNPENPENPFIDGLIRILKLSGHSKNEANNLIHGTTIVTNSIIEGNVAKVGLLVTEGFRDLLEIGRQQRPDLYDLKKGRKASLVRRDLVGEIRERVSSNKKVILPLDKKQSLAQIKTLKKKNIDTLAISLLFSFYHPIHERILEKLAQKMFDKRHVFISSRISPEFREFERTSTTVIAAAVAPKVVNYISSIRTKLSAQVMDHVRMRIMHSGGGTLETIEAEERPHALIESGPAAGVVGAAYLSKKLNLNQVLAFDMGGTTAKVGMVLKGKLQYSQEYEVGGEFHHAGRQRGSGYPVRSPMIDIVECGAGAGSIAWIDEGGHLKVGPQSAGADPGPACYGKGGENPTVADAHVILGRLRKENFLGGKLPIYPDLSEKVIKRNICVPFNIKPVKAALGILSIANTNMLRILRLISIARGYDPRDFALMAYGGAGPLHATELAEMISINHVVIPFMPGLFSSFGLLCTELSTDFVETIMIPITRIGSFNKAITRLKKKADVWFEQNGVIIKARKMEVRADLRYSHQNHELNISLPHLSLTKNDIQIIQKRFHKAHTKAYGHYAPDDKIQIVNLRLRAIKHYTKPRLPNLDAKSKLPVAKNAKTRLVWFKEGRLACQVFKRSTLTSGFRGTGPAVIEEKESTTLIRIGWDFQVDRFGNLHIRRHIQKV